MRPLPALLLGLALGTAATLAVRHLQSPPATPTSPTASDSASASALLAPSSLLLAPSPILPPAEADAGLAAYLALPPLPPDAATADIHARFTHLRALLTILPTSHFDRLFAALALRNGDPEARCRRIAFIVWTERDAPAAARWALALVPGEAVNKGARANYVHTAALAWAELDFDAAYAWVATFDDTELSRSIVGRLLSRLVVSDPTRALTLARSLGDDFFAANRQAIFDAWSESDPAAAIRSLGPELLQQKGRAWVAHRAIGQWLARDPAAAFAWIQAQPDESQGYYDSLLYTVVGQAARDPASAHAVAKLLLAHPELPNQLPHLMSVSISWSQKDPAGLVSWLRSLPADDQRTRLVEHASQMLPANEFLDALQLLPEGPDRAKRLADRLNGFAKSDPTAALAWIAAHPSPEVAAASTQIEGAFIANLAQTDPAAAVARLESLSDSSQREAAVAPLALAWAATDPAAALRFLADEATRRPSSAPPSESLQRTTQNIASRLARQDPAAVLKWAATLTQPALRQSAYYALANDHDFHSYGQSPTPVSHSVRADLLAAIPDSEARQKPLTFLLSNWLNRDYDSARAWLETQDALTPEAAARLLEATSPENIPEF